MANNNFDFGGHIQDDTDVSPRRYSEEEELCLSPYGLILNHVGFERGRALYAALLRIANEAAKQHAGKPAIVFDVDGGRFVAISKPGSGA